ncbi:CHAD domain-containing protein [Streptomyces spiralis]|uniref:CHAD domain-containing protein n=1 Tax=Streptomyces spiralis TaxID=66376 RepID=A0A919AE90_9ACTN|nr:CHAD domain-containing protein [Streptomyces spiralis]GHE99753.1 CHAD domain-containing protein [Streptomyces spiralis]
MAQRHLDPTDPTAAGPVAVDALAGYLRAQATEFLRALRLHRETGGSGAAGGSEESVDAARALRRAARRISGTLHTFRPLLDETWAEELRPELAWLSGTLAREHAYQARLDRLLQALHRLSPQTDVPDVAAGSRTSPGAERLGGTPRAARVGDGGAPARARSSVGEAPGTAGTVPHPTAPTPDRGNGNGNLTVGAAKAGALLDRQLTLARTRAHSTALQALGSSRFHAVADKVAVLASDVPLTPTAHTMAPHPLATDAEERLTDAVAALPLVTAGSPYNAAALVHGLSPDPSPHPQDAPWHQVRLLLRLHRYAQEALHAVDGEGAPVDVRLLTAGRALDRHRDASEAAAAAAAAARTPRIAPATAYALGVLHADQRHEVEAARFAFQQAWQMQAIGAN